MADPAPGTLDFIVRQNPGGEALIAPGVRRTWQQWDERARRLASFLRSRFGIRRGDRVAWMLHNRPEYFDLAFALAKLGALGVPIGYRLTGSEAAYIISDSDSTLVVCETEFAPRLEAGRAEMPGIAGDRFLLVGDPSLRGDALREAMHLDEAIAAGSPEPIVADAPTSGSILYTSGTTGRPKGAFRDASDPALHSGLREFMIGVVAGFRYAPGDRHLLVCPLYHSAPPTIAGISHLLGGCVALMPRFDAEQALATIERERITSTFMVPTMLNRIVSLPAQVRARYDLSSMARLIVGAAPFPAELKRRVVEMFPKPCVYEFYGSTETAINTIIGPEDQLRKLGSCGKIVPGNEIRILDDEGRDVPPGELGTLYVRNPFVITGYYKNRAATQECLRDGFFTVGDVARVDEEGFYYIVDRKRDMIISGGVNIYPAEIERELLQHPDVYDCAVIGVPHEEWGEEVKAVVQLREGAQPDAAGIQAFLAGRLADYKRPRSIDFVDELPYNPSGKLLKKELRRRYWEGTGRAI
jgi:acyl-CoA synthetase (AMP-forming)/AMP-acid ligase II